MSASVNQDVFHLKFATEDGHQSSVSCPHPDTLSLDDEAPVVFFYPAMGTSAAFYHRLLRPMAQVGIRFVILEQRGCAGSSQKASAGVNAGYKQLVEVDMKQAIATVKKQYPTHGKFVLCGHSLGGQLSILYAAAFPEQVDGVFLICSVSAYWRTYATWAMCFQILLASNVFPVLAWSKGYHPGKSVGFGSTEFKGVIEDWSHQASSGLYEPQGSSINYESRIREIKVPVFGVVVAGDDRAPMMALKHLFSKVYNDEQLVNANVIQISLPEKVMKAPHFAWVKEPSSAIDQLQSFISRL